MSIGQDGRHGRQDGHGSCPMCGADPCGCGWADDPDDDVERGLDGAKVAALGVSLLVCVAAWVAVIVLIVALVG